MPRSLRKRSKVPRSRRRHAQRMNAARWGYPDPTVEPVPAPPVEFVPSQGRYNMDDDRSAVIQNQSQRSFVDYIELYLACRIKVFIAISG